MKDKLILRLAEAKDGEEISKLYKPYVENTAVSFEYTAPDGYEMTSRIISKTEKYPFIVAELQGKIVGYAYASPFLPRPAYIHSVETSVYVDMDMKAKGIGTALYRALEEVLKLQKVIYMNACIAVTHTPDETLDNNSMVFHNKMGYRYVGRFNCSGYKFQRFYDMIWMEKELTEPIEPFDDFIPFPAIKDRVEEILTGFSDVYNKTVN